MRCVSRKNKQQQKKNCDAAHAEHEGTRDVMMLKANLSITCSLYDSFRLRLSNYLQGDSCECVTSATAVSSNTTQHHWGR